MMGWWCAGCVSVTYMYMCVGREISKRVLSNKRCDVQSDYFFLRWIRLFIIEEHINTHVRNVIKGLI